MAIPTTPAPAAYAGICTGGRSLRGIWSDLNSIFIQIKHRAVHLRPCNPVGATLAVALAAPYLLCTVNLVPLCGSCQYPPTDYIKSNCAVKCRSIGA